METNKPFKTISLEERLAQSAMGKFNPKTHTVTDKPTVNLKDQQAVDKKKAAQLKIRKEGLEKSSPILKQMIRTIQEPVYPTITLFQSSNLADKKIPQPYTSFPNTIRLGDRLKQPLDGKTTHLPKYFLSDTYSGIVRATPFTTSPLASRVQIDPYGFGNKKVSTFYQKPDPKKGSPILQGLVEPAIPTQTQSTGISIKPVIQQTTNAFLQGIVVADSGLASIINIQESVNDVVILTRQGAVITNNVLLSRTIVKSAILSQDLDQGTVAIKSTIGIKDNAILQGLLLRDGEIASSITIPIAPLPIPPTRNGIRRIPLEPPALFKQLPLSAKRNTSPLINDSGQPSAPTTKYLGIGPILQNLSETTQALESNITGYKSVGTPFDFTPTYYSPTIKVIEYDADQLLARFAPILKHGAAAIQPFQTDIVQGEDGLTAAKIDVQDLLTTPQTGPYKELNNTGNNIEFTSVRDQAGARKQATKFGDVNTDTFTGVGNVTQATWRSIIKALSNGSLLDMDRLVNFPGSGQGSLSAYKASAYGQIRSTSTKAAARSGLSAQAASGPNPQIGNNGTKNVPDYNGKDYIPVKIKSATIGTTAVFKAYLTSFSDSFSTSWNDVQYVGRQETLKQFKGVTRGISLALSVPSFSKVDLPINMKKVQDAINITSIASYQAAGGINYLYGPLCQLTLGGFFKDVYCVFNSFKIDFDPAESTWDIDSGLPHLLKISMDASILGDVNGKGLDAKSSAHYSFSG